MTEDQIEAISNLGVPVGYFKRQSTSNKKFLPELDVASRIVNHIKSKSELSELDLKMIADIYNEIIDYEHYNGSGWHDFQMRLTRFFWVFGYDTRLDTETKKLDIIKTLPNKMHM